MTASANHWSKQRLKWCFTSCKNGVWGNEPDGDNDVPVVRVADFNRVNFTVDFASPTLRSIKETELESNGLSSGDLLLEKSGGGENQLVGTVVGFDFDGPAVCSNFVAKLSVAAGFHSRFLVYLNAALYDAKINLRSIKQTTGIQNLDSNAYLDEVVLLPDYLTQQSIALYLDRETSAIDTLIFEKESMLGLLEEKRQALVSHAVTQGIDSKAKMKATGIAWLDRCPAHWETMQLKRTWESADYGTSSSIRDKGEIRVLRMSCITKSGTVDLNNAGQIEEIEESLFLQKGDILFNRTNSIDQIAKVGLVVEDPDDPTAFASYLVRIRVNERVDNRYLVKLLNSRDFLKFARANAIPAIGQANLSPTRYGDLHVPIPPRTEQLEIVEHIDEAVASSNAFETDLEMSITLLKERRSALITAAVTGQIKMEK